jgi:hypothetical protein
MSKLIKDVIRVHSLDDVNALILKGWVLFAIVEDWWSEVFVLIKYY